MKNNVFIDLIESKDLDIIKSYIRKGSEEYFLYSNVFGIKYEWWDRNTRIVLGYGNSRKDREKMFEEISKIIEQTTKIVKRKNTKSYVSFYLPEDISNDSLENVFEEIYDYFETNCDQWEKNVKNASLEIKNGVSFNGTIFENLKERGATMSPMFGSMVCKASGMRIDRMLCEYYIPGGRIDGVEIDNEGNITSIYECGSGIHKGDFLDWDHWNKVLCKYLYSNKVYTQHLKRVVILAGGYCEEILSIAKNVSLLLEKSNIEFILLKTDREENNITIVKI